MIQGNAGGPRLPPDREFLTLLGRTVSAEAAYDADVEGRIPDGLRGVLFRNGPGRFERAGHRRHHLLDGDGMIQRFQIGDQHLHYRNRFVSTDKYLAEEKAGRTLFPTWSTRAPGGILRNCGLGRLRSQAGVTVFPAPGGSHLLACDEVGLPWAIDPDSLATLGERPIGGLSRSDMLSGRFTLKAHTRIDAVDGSCTLLGITYGRGMSLTAIICDKSGQVIAKHNHPMPRAVYLHDFLATERHVLVLLHPAFLSLVPFLTGCASYMACLRWRPHCGGIMAVLDKAGTEKPLFLDVPAAFMWHGLNAFQHGSSLVADWIGFDAPDHFIGADPRLAAIMEGRLGQADAKGTLRRTVIDLNRRTAVQSVVADGNFEFPFLPSAQSGRRHRYGYVAAAGEGAILHDGIARIDTDGGDVRAFHFGPTVQVGEPVSTSSGEQDGGWVLALCLDGRQERSFLAIFAADAIEDGPIARAWLRHPCPISFHGCWRAA